MKSIRGSDLARPGFKANPYPFYARLRAEEPVCRISALWSHAWLLTRYDDVVEFLRDDRFAKDITAKMPWVPGFLQPALHHMLNRDPPDHTRLRALVSKAFTPRRIERLRGRIEQVCEELVAGAPRDRPFDLVGGYALRMPLTIIGELLGIPDRDRPRFHTFTRGSLPLIAPTGIADVAFALPYSWLLLRYFRRLIADRREHPGEDLVTALVQAEEGGDRLTEDEVVGMAVLLLLAGYETTVHLIASGALALLQHPQQRERFLGDPEVAETAIDELLRYTSPIEITPPRVAREDVTIRSVTIPLGDMVAAVIGSANHDESQFPEPERLDLGRRPNRHVAFGQGIHFCLGAPLAELEGRIALETLFRRFPGVKLAQPAESLRWRKAMPLRGLEELPVTL